MATLRSREDDEVHVTLEKLLPFLPPEQRCEARQIAPFVVAYRPLEHDSARPVDLELLRPDPDARRLCPPGTLNPFLHEPELLATRRGLEEGFSAFVAAGDETSAPMPIREWRDILRLDMLHTSRAVCHYTNGQRVVSEVELAQGRRHLALHHVLEEDILHGMPRRPSIDASKMLNVGIGQDIEAAACRFLEGPETTEVHVVTDDKVGTLSMRRWGSARADHGYRRQLLILTSGTRVGLTELNGDGGSPHSAYAVLNRLGEVLPNVRADTCATCRYFAFSRMSRDMSGASAGYCRDPARPRAHTQWVGFGETPVSVFDRCNRHEYVPDSERARPLG
ncbi:MAG: hypothetical protein B7733_23995 [Myxococcales bacterium FL481]|nr:MAG: hypothetical protein B7733_23995 [Myxococcales bacterium FL481]